jgi:hypothetical protein
VLSTDGKWLAWRTAGNQVSAALPSGEILMVNVAFDQRPMTHQFKPATLVGTDRLASVVVVFKHGIMLETGVGRGESQSTCASKQLNTPQLPAGWQRFITQDSPVAIILIAPVG